MPRIQWMGNQDWNKDYPEVDLPGHAQRIEMPANKMRVSIIYGILPFLLCLACLYLKKALYGEFPFDKPYVFVGILLGFCLIPVHELLHAVCCPPDSVAYYGISLNKFSAFCVCHYPMSRKRAIVMSLLPAILGIIPLVLFCVFPISWKIPSAICWAAAAFGLLSPSPDYMDVHYILKQVPKQAYIQSNNSGWFWYE